jgi:hypothetical protein
MDGFPVYDAYLVHFYVHSPDYDNVECEFCVITQLDMQVPEDPFPIINSVDFG